LIEASSLSALAGLVSARLQPLDFRLPNISGVG
jgi:hypothetical protein